MNEIFSCFRTNAYRCLFVVALHKNFCKFLPSSHSAKVFFWIFYPFHTPRRFFKKTVSRVGCGTSQIVANLFEHGFLQNLQDSQDSIGDNSVVSLNSPPSRRNIAYHRRNLVNLVKIPVQTNMGIPPAESCKFSKSCKNSGSDKVATIWNLPRTVPETHVVEIHVTETHAVCLYMSRERTCIR